MNDQSPKPASQTKPSLPEMTFVDFLQDQSPTKPTTTGEPMTINRHPGGEIRSFSFKVPDKLSLHCPTKPTCSGIRTFKRQTQEAYSFKLGETYVPRYLCSNCDKFAKSFAIIAIKRSGQDDEQKPVFEKLGEFPKFGSPIPDRLLDLLGDQKSLFLLGRQCENQGLGIGAFSYYRRAVENLKNKLFDRIIEVAKKVEPASSIIAALEQAKAETQFTKAVDSIKPALPQVLLINGHNPLTALHRALSDGLHEQSDDHCLAIAHDVRLVLGELSDRLDQALKDDKELNSAIGRLLQKGSKQTS
jgi:hypothetical protein